MECRLSGNQGTVICDDGGWMRDDGQAVDPAKILAVRLQVIKAVCGAAPFCLYECTQKLIIMV